MSYEGNDDAMGVTQKRCNFDITKSLISVEIKRVGGRNVREAYEGKSQLLSHAYVGSYERVIDGAREIESDRKRRGVERRARGWAVGLTWGSI